MTIEKSLIRVLTEPLLRKESVLATLKKESAVLYKDPSDAIKVLLSLGVGGGLGYGLRSLMSGGGDKKQKEKVLDTLKNTSNSINSVTDMLKSEPQVVLTPEEAAQMQAQTSLLDQLRGSY